MKPTAKGKKRRERIEADEDAIKELEAKAVIPTVKAEKREKQSVSSLEIKNVVKDTMDRMFQEFHPRMGERERSAYADDRAIQMLRIIKHGIPEPGSGARITEEEQEAPLCRNCQ
jgi:hypothetical protein